MARVNREGNRTKGAYHMTDRKSLPTYTAWLSTCLLSASAGHLVGDAMGLTWFILGTFGLIAAFGLQVASRHLDRQQV
jgi:hypothetical protein